MILGFVLGFVFVYSLVGFKIFWHNLSMIEQAWGKGKYIRCFLVAAPMGPLVWLFCFITLLLFLYNIINIATLYVLQEVPDTGSSKDDPPHLIRYPRPVPHYEDIQSTSKTTNTESEED